jgi:hypothetical protein
MLHATEHYFGSGGIRHEERLFTLSLVKPSVKAEENFIVFIY